MPHERRSRKPTLHQRLDHLFYLSWKRHEIINRRIKSMAGELDRVQTEVTEIGGAVDSAIALIEKIAQMIRDNATNPAALNKIADDLDAKGTALAAAVVANDPDTPSVP
jgi:predicted RNA-binding Zn ribbon-like protein